MGKAYLRFVYTWKWSVCAGLVTLLCWLVAASLFFIMPMVYFLVWYAALVLLVVAQVYRYRTASSPLQRQQGKWLLFGGCVAIIIIHRTLVYSTLTVVLAVIYEVSVFTLQSLTSGLTFIRGNQLAIVASTFLIAALFQPLRRRIQAIIDRRFYRRKYDAAKTVEAFSATLRNEVDLNQLREQL